MPGSSVVFTSYSQILTDQVNYQWLKLKASLFITNWTPFLTYVHIGKMSFQIQTNTENAVRNQSYDTQYFASAVIEYPGLSFSVGICSLLLVWHGHTEPDFDVKGNNQYPEWFSHSSHSVQICYPCWCCHPHFLLIFRTLDMCRYENGGFLKACVVKKWFLASCYDTVVPTVMSIIEQRSQETPQDWGRSKYREKSLKLNSRTNIV